MHAPSGYVELVTVVTTVHQGHVFYPGRRFLAPIDGPALPWAKPAPSPAAAAPAEKKKTTAKR